MVLEAMLAAQPGRLVVFLVDMMETLAARLGREEVWVDEKLAAKLVEMHQVGGRGHSVSCYSMVEEEASSVVVGAVGMEVGVVVVEGGCMVEVEEEGMVVVVVVNCNSNYLA